MTATYAGVTVTLTVQEQREINAGLSELRLDAAREVLEARAEA